MAGTKLGGEAAARTNKAKYGQDFYQRIGSTGGRVTGVAKGFALDRDRARTAGAKGGAISRRGARNSRPTLPLIEEPRRTLINRLKEMLHV